ncbi:MAG: hydrogenase nickel incorporation protein HypA [Candidatus Limnocylindrales bacterium]
MHEWALAEAVIVKASEVAEQNGLASVSRVELRIGELQAIDRDSFEFGLGLLRSEYPRLTGAVFALASEPAELRCRRCGHAWYLAESVSGLSEEDREAIHLLPEAVHLYVTCPACASPDFEVLAGRGVSLVSVS